MAGLGVLTADVGESKSMSSQEMTQEDKVEAIAWRYAEELLRNPCDTFKAAMIVTFSDTIAALRLSQELQYSSKIARMQQHLIKELGEEAFLPTKETMVSEVYARARRSTEDDAYVKMMALVFDVRGMSSKSGSVVVNDNSTTNNRIMQIPVLMNREGSPANEQEWEEQLIVQQEKLTNDF